MPWPKRGSVTSSAVVPLNQALLRTAVRAGPGSDVALLLPTVVTCYCPGFQLHSQFYGSSSPKRSGVFHLPEWRTRNAFCRHQGVPQDPLPLQEGPSGAWLISQIHK